MGKHGPSETILHNGVAYRRYPESDVRAIRVYYTAQRGKRLHRVLYEEAHGVQLPRTTHVHHIDGDPLNNDLSNLEAVDGRKHLSEHMLEPENVAKSRESIKIAIQHAPEWHRSEEGRAWHRENGRATMAARAIVDCLCKVCGVTFQSKFSNAAMCSPKCRAKDRRESGLDDINFVCPECGIVFRRSKFSKPGCCCSLSCAGRNSTAKRLASRARSRGQR